MSLSSALNNVQSIFNTTALQSSVVSTNIANVSNSDYVKARGVDHDVSGRCAGRQHQPRAGNRAAVPVSQLDLQGQCAADAAERARKPAIADRVATTTRPRRAPICRRSRQALQTFSTTPSSTIAAQSAVTAAQDLANSLNTASDGVHRYGRMPTAILPRRSRR
jgi:flagellar hook-associated protein 1 FlgK